MEKQVTTKFYIVLDMVDGSLLYYNNSVHLRNWSAYRREGTSWEWKKGADNALTDQLNLDNIPANARVIELRTTIEEVIDDLGKD